MQIYWREYNPPGVEGKQGAERHVNVGKKKEKIWQRQITDNTGAIITIYISDSILHSSSQCIKKETDSQQT